MGRIPQSLIIAAGAGARQSGCALRWPVRVDTVLEVALRLAQRRLGGGQPGDGHPQGGAGDVVETEIVAEADAGGVAAVLSTEGQLQLRVGGAPLFRGYLA